MSEDDGAPGQSDGIGSDASSGSGAPPVQPAPSAPAVSTTTGLPRPDYVFLVVVATISLAADLLSKWWATARHLDQDHWRPYDFFDGHLKLIYAENPGGAFGLLGREPQWLRVPTFIVISIAAIWFILHLYRRLEPRQKALKLGLPLVFAGAIGNLADRVRYNFVVDFIDVSGKSVRFVNELLGNASDHWPTFNIADVVIVVGVLLMAVDMFQSRKPKTTIITHPPSVERVEPRSSGGSLSDPPAPPPETHAETHPEG